MKYLMIYESFKSKQISSILNYIKPKVGLKNANRFIEELIEIQSIYDFQISEITNDDIKYLSKNAVLKMQNEKDIEYYNPQKISNIVFWFSVDDGFLDKTAISKSVKDKIDTKFSKDEIDYIKNNLGIKTGQLIKTKDYSEIKHGDYVVVYLNGPHEEDPRYYKSITLARIFKEGAYLYAIQDSAQGSTPDLTDDWKKWGRFSWSLGMINDRGRDHFKLHIWKKGPDKLESFDKEELSDKVENKVINYKGEAIEDDYTVSNIIKNSDYVLVLNINDIFKRGFKKVSDIRKEREVSKEGALSLMSDAKIKEININKYLKLSLSKMGIDSDIGIKDLDNLQKFVEIIICGEFSFYTIVNNNTDIYNIIKISDYINCIFKEEDLQSRKSCYEELVERFKYLKRLSSNIKKDYKKSIDTIKSHDFDNKDIGVKINKLFYIFDKISKEIINYLKRNKIDNLYDLSAVYYKLKFVRSLIGDDKFRLSYNTRSILSEFEGGGDVLYYLNKDMDIKTLDLDIEKAYYLYKNIKSILN
jgi:hypothetical protein